MNIHKIRKYARLRGIEVRSLVKAWKNADEGARDSYREEMQAYFKAIETKQINPGEPITKIAERAKAHKVVDKEIKKTRT